MTRRLKITLIVVLVLLVGILYYFFGTLSNGLTRKQNMAYAEFYHLECEQDLETVKPWEELIFTPTHETHRTIETVYFFLHGMREVLSEEYEILYEDSRKILIRAIRLSGSNSSNINTAWCLNHPVSAYYLCSRLPDQMFNYITYRKDGLDLKAYIKYCLFYGIGVEDGYKAVWEYDGSYELTVSHDIIQGELDLLQSIIWEGHEDVDIEDQNQAKDVLINYGFSQHFPMTSEWVLNNVQEASELRSEINVRVTMTYNYESPVRNQSTEWALIRSCLHSELDDWIENMYNDATSRR